jgi:hypothetical protein
MCTDGTIPRENELPATTGDEPAAAKARAQLFFRRRTALELLEAAHHGV